MPPSRSDVKKILLLSGVTDTSSSFQSPYVICCLEPGAEGSKRKIFAFVPRTDE